MAEDRGKFQASKTAMAAHCSLLYIARKKQGAAIAVLLAWNFPLSLAMVHFKIQYLGNRLTSGSDLFTQGSERRDL